MTGTHIQMVTSLRGDDGQRTLAEALENLRDKFNVLAEETDIRLTSKPHITVVRRFGGVALLVAKCTATRNGGAA